MSSAIFTFFVVFFFVQTANAVDTVDICARTEQVKIALLEKLPKKSNCSLVKTSDLAEIFVLDLSNKNISTLQTGDLKGLSNLLYLDLHNNQLHTLPEGIFNNLNKLDSINLGENRLSTLPHDVFSNLPNLTSIKLNTNSLSKLPDSVSTALPKLRELDVRYNEFHNQSFAFLDKLHNLTTLGVDKVDLINISHRTLRKIIWLEPGRGRRYASVDEFAKPITLPPVLRGQARTLFATEYQYQLNMFSAYGILAFNTRPNENSYDRYMAICHAFISTFLPITVNSLAGINVDQYRQMVTVWPIDSVNRANSLNSRQVSHDSCDDIVNDISLSFSLNYIRRAQDNLKTIRKTLSGNGPFLLAWSSSQSNNDERNPFLLLNLSDVINVQQAEKLFVFWRDQIEKDPTLWAKRWNMERIRLKLMVAADKLGNLFGGNGVLQFYSSKK